ncbi:putative E3 ubiquitin-protein ligase TRIP12 [Trachymyrmex septentrionalis]|uniref:E3 ubiquitin-protein ligase n=1 Tax=Trachymyrmex septentrionalis TaxID=34720 RepID=A0A195F9P5_9HYME|nr:putative E3 ubiquitin-protein ligase TRIP12 [Trachymyrmex septentrionalis]
MCARVLACPLCSQPGFLTLDALRAGLVSVATRPLICPVCNEVLLGIDKLTIHLFGHTINLNNATAELSKSADIAATDEHLVAIHNPHNIAPQNWNILKQLDKIESNLIEEEHDLPNFQSVQNIIANVCARKSPEEHNNKEDLPNAKNTILETNAEDQNQNLEHEQILSHIRTSAKAIRTIAPKEKTERCNLCGFYFPDTNILALHEKLVHEQDSSNNPEKVLKNYSCYLCSKVFKMRGSLMVHMRVAHIGHNSGNFSHMIGSFSKGDQNEVTCGDAGYACPTCGKKFKKLNKNINFSLAVTFQEQHVIQHLKTHEGKQWECDTCSKMFTTKNTNDCIREKCLTNVKYVTKVSPSSNRITSTDFITRMISRTPARLAVDRSRNSPRYIITKGFIPERSHSSARHVVSQRTHKCPVQTSGSTQQSRQPVLALQSEINNISSERKEQGIEFTDASNTNEDLKSKTWGDALNSTGLKESAELIERVQSDNEKINAKSTNDFFSMVMSPLETSISSSTFEIEHLRVSSPKHKEDPIDSYTDFSQVSGNVQMNLEPDIEQNFSHNKDVTESMQTINEESLKELLYGSRNLVIVSSLSPRCLGRVSPAFRQNSGMSRLIYGRSTRSVVIRGVYSVEEKRRRQTTSDLQTSQVDSNTPHTHSIDSSKGEGRIRGERRSHGAGLESYSETDWRSHHKIHQVSYNSSSSTRVRSAARTSLPESSLTPTDCVASRTRSRTPQNPQALTQGTSSYDLSLPSGYGSRKTSTYSNLVASSSATSITSHPSTSRGRGENASIIKIRVIDQTVSLGQRMSECLEGFVSAVKALFPISTQTYHQEDSKSHGGATCSATSSSTSSQVLGVKSSIRVGNAASNSVESGGGALAHDGAGTSGIASTATANPPVSATVSANPTHPHSTHKHLLRSRAKATGEQPKELPSSNKTSGKHHKKDTTTGSCSSSRHRSSSRVRKPVVESGSGGLGSVMSGNDSISATSVSSSIPSSQLVSTTGEEESASTATSATDRVIQNFDFLLAREAGGGPSGMSGTTGDSESDDGEVGRLQALLEARGLPPHVFGALGPRMQHLLNRSMGASSAAKAQQLLAGLQAVEDEGEQLQAVMNMGEILVMGNEDTLTGFPVKQVVAALINLLGIEHNFAIMTHACRALTYMMEALPRSSTVVVDAVPVFLQKLESIECMDVAEQCLTALAMLSRRHSKTILHAGGVSACLKFVDFFNITAQRAALTITANCCQNLHPDDFHLVVDSLSLLTSRLTNQDKKSVECVCQAFSRLVDSFQHDPVMLHKIINAELLQNLQQLLMITPPVNSTNNFITVLRMLSVISNRCPDLAQLLLQQNIAFTLSYLLTGSLEVKTEDVELVPRTPQEWFEITCLIEELMPPLPTDGIFSVNSLLERTSNQQETVQWEWRDERQCSHPFSTIDSRIIEMAFQNGEDEICLTSLGRTYTIDLTVMKQINEDIGMTRSIFRRVNANPTEGKRPTCSSSMDVVPPVIETNEWLVSFIRTLFSVLYEVYSSSAGPAVKCKCLRALLRMVYYASTDLLKDVLKNQVVSSHIAGMLASQDLRIVIGALQMASILMKRLPQVFGVHFHREGVLHQVRQLADPEVPLGVSPPKCPSGTSLPSPQPGPSNTPLSSTTMLSSSSATSPVVSPSSNGNILFGTIASSCQYKPNISASLEPHRTELNNSVEETSAPQSAHLRIGDVLKKKRQNKKGRFSRLGGTTTPQQTQQPESLFTGFTPKNNRFLGNLNPAKWGRKSSSSSTSNDKRDSSSSTNLSKPPSNPSLTGGNRDKAKAWVREQAAQFLARYQDDAPCSHPALTVLARLTAAIQRLQSNELDEMLSALTELRDIVLESDISPFEMNYSGLIKALLNYLTTTDAPGNRYDRLRMFWKLFAESTMQQNNDIMDLNPGAFGALVTKLNSCVAQLEQFPVKVHDLPAGSGAGRGGTSALKFFNTHQLKCNLQRHPDCNNLKQWKGGTVKIDPLALVQAIERYLMVRGYGRIRDADSMVSDDDNSEDDIDDTLAAVVISQGPPKHKLQFLIGDVVLPFNMTVYQAVRQFGCSGVDHSEAEADSEPPLGHDAVWVQTHTIYYRPVPEEDAATSPKSGSSSQGNSRKGKGKSTKISSKRKEDSLWLEGMIPLQHCPLAPYLSPTLPPSVTITDASLDGLCLLRLLHALNRHWGILFPHLKSMSLLSPQDFINNKIAAKASRQLQDPLVIMTGNLPSWLQQIASVCPFLFPFETRQLLLYATSFDRDRALQRLLDSAPELSGSDSQERVTPRLERRKRTISRTDILKQAELVIQDLASNKALLEVQYVNEVKFILQVGTGLGPTLEFYALVSKELQRADLDLWHGSSNPTENGYVNSSHGLFPTPIPWNTKVSHLAKLKTKFKFLGKFMAKAIYDSRMLDLPFSLTFYRWLLGEEHTLTLADLAYVCPDVYRTLSKLQEVVRKKEAMEKDQTLRPHEKAQLIEALDLDTCPISELGLVFELPGYENIELRKGGSEISVTIYNLDQYIKLVVHWFLYEGIFRQMEAFREGFESVFPPLQLRLFFPEELEAVFCGHAQTGGQWDVKTLAECCRTDHGYTPDSRAIRFLFEVMSKYNSEEQRQFIQFVTGSPRLPVGGFKSLTPPLTIVRKTFDPSMKTDDFLPSVMTCVNYLKLPDYTTLEIMREKLRIAAQEGQHSFHLS